jgi:hypothetical protein
MSSRIDPNGLKNAWTEWRAGLGNLAQGPAGQVYKEWEAWFGAQFEKLAKNETFLGQTAKSMENSFLLKSQFDRMMETSAHALRMPTAGDIDQVHKRLDEMERRDLAVGMATLFVGLALSIPILGHATWHLYRRALA